MDAREKQLMRQFLRDVTDADVSIDSVARNLGVSDAQLYRWSRSGLFARWLRRRERFSATYRELEVARGALSAAEQMTARIAGRVDKDAEDLKEPLRKLWTDAIKLARAREDKQDALERQAQRKKLEGPAAESAAESMIVSPLSPDELNALLGGSSHHEETKRQM